MGFLHVSIPFFQASLGSSPSWKMHYSPYIQIVKIIDINKMIYYARRLGGDC